MFALSNKKPLSKKSLECLENIFFMGDSHTRVTHNHIEPLLEGFSERDKRIICDVVKGTLVSEENKWQFYVYLMVKEGYEIDMYPTITEPDWKMDLNAACCTLDRLIVHQVKDTLNTSMRAAVTSGKLLSFGYLMFPSPAWDIRASEETIVESIIQAGGLTHKGVNLNLPKTYNPQRVKECIFERVFSTPRNL